MNRTPMTRPRRARALLFAALPYPEVLASCHQSSDTDLTEDTDAATDTLSHDYGHAYEGLLSFGIPAELDGAWAGPKSERNDCVGSSGGLRQRGHLGTFDRVPPACSGLSLAALRTRGGAQNDNRTASP